MGQLVRRNSANGNRHCLRAGISANTRNDRHQRRQSDHLGDRAFKQPDDRRSDERRDQVRDQPPDAAFVTVEDRFVDVAVAGAGKLQNILARLFLNDVHHVVDRDHPDKAPCGIDNRRRDQRIFLEAERDFLLVHVDGDQRLLALHDVRHADIARSAQDPAQICGPDRLVLRIDDKDFPEIGRQVLVVAEIIDYLPDRHMLRHRNQVALHQAAGGFLRIGQRLFDRRPVIGRKLAQDGALVLLLHVLDDRDSIVGLEFARNVRNLARVERIDQFLAHMVVQFGNHIAVEQVRERCCEIRAQFRRRLFEQVSDIGRVQRRNEFADAFVLSSFDGVENLADESRFQLIVFIEVGVRDQLFGADRISFAHLSLRYGSPPD